MADNATVALLSMPFHSVTIPPNGPSILKSTLEAEGIDARVYNFNIDLLPHISPDLAHAVNVFDEICRHWACCLGEWIFAPTKNPQEDESFLSSLGLIDEIRQQVLELKFSAQGFMDQAAELLLEEKHDIFGFSLMLMQTQASCGVARRIKQRRPEARIMLGGPCVAGALGSGLLRGFDEVDIVAHGEVDNTIVPLVRAIRGEPGFDLGYIPGISYRNIDRTIIQQTANASLPEMDSVAIPNFLDYFEQIAAMDYDTATDSLPTYIPLETARGCWWGEKEHCTFCGLNADRMPFRSKSIPMVLDELKSLRETYATSSFLITDNILDFRYPAALFPLLRRIEPGATFYCAIKQNVSARKVRNMAMGGLTRVQPGIETLSTSLLRKMRKGATLLDNLACLKWLAQYGIQAEWNLLHGTPGENVAEYQAMARVIPRIMHLGPPRGLCPIVIDRFSPYYSDPAAFCLEILGPTPGYHHSFPNLTPDNRAQIAFYFEAREHGRNGEVDHFITDEISPLIEQWRHQFINYKSGLCIVYGDRESLLLEGHWARPKRVVRLPAPWNLMFRSLEQSCLLRRIEAGDFSSGKDIRIIDNESIDLLQTFYLDSGAAISTFDPATVKEAIIEADARGYIHMEQNRALGLAVNCTENPEVVPKCSPQAQLSFLLGESGHPLAGPRWIVN